MLKQTPDRNTKSTIFPVFTQAPQTGLATQTLQQKSRYNLLQIPIIHQTIAHNTPE